MASSGCCFLRVLSCCVYGCLEVHRVSEGAVDGCKAVLSGSL